eukprot:1156138-Pelagomonas_calceolata.AAC.5
MDCAVFSVLICPALFLFPSLTTALRHQAMDFYVSTRGKPGVNRAARCSDCRAHLTDPPLRKRQAHVPRTIKNQGASYRKCIHRTHCTAAVAAASSQGICGRCRDRWASSSKQSGRTLCTAATAGAVNSKPGGRCVANTLAGLTALLLLLVQAARAFVADAKPLREASTSARQRMNSSLPSRTTLPNMGA